MIRLFEIRADNPKLVVPGGGEVGLDDSVVDKVMVGWNGDAAVVEKRLLVWVADKRWSQAPFAKDYRKNHDGTGEVERRAFAVLVRVTDPGAEVVVAVKRVLVWVAEERRSQCHDGKGEVEAEGKASVVSVTNVAGPHVNLAEKARRRIDSVAGRRSQTRRGKEGGARRRCMVERVMDARDELTGSAAKPFRLDRVERGPRPGTLYHHSSGCEVDDVT
ncbi:unnamed protein product [Closterium sp. NIES-54]